MLARISHPMHTYLLGREKNQSIRSSADTHTNKHRQRQTWSLNANHWTYISIRTKTHTRRQTWSPKANHWTYIGIRTKHTYTGTRMPLDGLTSASKHTTTHTEGLKTKRLKKKKGARRDQLISCLRTSSGMRIRAT